MCQRASSAPRNTSPTARRRPRARRFYPLLRYTHIARCRCPDSLGTFPGGRAPRTQTGTTGFWVAVPFSQLLGATGGRGGMLFAVVPMGARFGGACVWRECCAAVRTSRVR